MSIPLTDPLSFVVTVRKHVNYFTVYRRLPAYTCCVIFVFLEKRFYLPAHTENNSAAACGNRDKNLEEHASETGV
jgi:hypothetical protein